MYERKSRRYCAAMVILSVCLRLCMLLGLDAKAAELLSQGAKNREFAKLLLFLETGQAVEAEEPPRETKLWTLRWMEPEQDEPIPVTTLPVDVKVPEKPLPVPAVLASASEIPIGGGCTYSVDKSALLARPSALDFSGDGPKILIVHTHGSEAYTPEPGAEYEAAGAYRTLDPAHSVIRVGDVLAETLESYGVEVLHDRTLNDYPDYNSAYYNALRKIEDWKAQYPGIQMVIDVHRDAVDDGAGHAVALSAMDDGQTVAQLMLVVGTDQGGLSHPNWQENLANALKLQSVLTGASPDLCRSLDLRTERFNQHAAPGAFLVEVGTNGSTLRQAEASARILGESLAQMIGALTQNGGLLQAAD